MKPEVTRCPTCKRKRTRSNPANARLWLLYHMMEKYEVPVIDENGDFVLDKNGNKRMTTHSAETWHYFFKKMFLGKTDIRLPNGKYAEVINSTAELDVSQFAEYMEQVEQFAAERGVYLDAVETLA